MKKSSLEKLDLELYEETLDNGLRVYVVPKENVNGIYVISLSLSMKKIALSTHLNKNAAI